MSDADPQYVEGAINTIPLDRLMLSSLNVRQTERAADVESLAEDIAARGLKQNLVVIPAHFMTGESRSTREGGKSWEGMFEVIAGGRRYQALQRLVADERLPADHPVPCMVEVRDAAAETSLSENLHCVAMNPADEFEAFRVIVEKFGSDHVAVGLCAKRFGVTVKHVQGRLRLASLAPDILEALRKNAITLDSAKAYAGVEDHALQLKVFKAQEKSSYSPHNPSSVRGALRDKTLSAEDATVRFVGLDAYIAAGGRVEAEMFMGTWGDQQRVVDISLIEKLAAEKAEPMLAPAAKADGFKSGLFARGVGNAAKWPKAPQGMERYISYYQDKAPTKAELKKSIAVYAVSNDGSGIAKIGHFHTPKPREPQEEHDWEAEYRAAARERAINRRAGQLAAYQIGSFKGTPLEGHAFWPVNHVPPIDFDNDEEHAYVAVLIRLPIADIDAQRAEAERLIDEEAVAKEAEKAAAAQQQAQTEEQDA
ncbi:ParB/RepB/Spo0J family partition protein [Novosphingobium mangrovi (ex Huang et al. 2023)]|uniref:ParB/RepB/Spo0J family partition protein n=1 Tax=Novosphingobium mangrovi (ex Huang et al. 2023) TaxID=2976432 RepID=A0ABT2I119_9SPHN|nr:ParB/RepB/Spo0J family partition protein [Novosphingobium mangrovi (ex Huang et al. 2023)]MCT2398490.1 ParB/RepB/Spo0J family partition protein [Novosphingobium mangrovi (ex Huang et al. 2023)]